MNKQEYFDLLRFYLKDLPKPVVDDILSDLYEHYSNAVKEGKSEEEISRELGSPRDIAEDYLENEGYAGKNYIKDKLKAKSFYSSSGEFKGAKKDKKEFSFVKVFSVIGLAVFLLTFGLPAVFVILGLILGVFGIIAALIAAGISFVAAGVAMPLTIMPGIMGFEIVHFPHFVMYLSPATKFLLGLVSVVFGILMLKFVLYIAKMLFKGIKKAVIYLRWKLSKKRQS